MMEPEMKLEEETKMIGCREDEEGRITDEENKDKIGNSAESDYDPALAGINLVMILSCLSMSAEEREHVEEEIGERENSQSEKKGKNVSSRSDFLIRRREVNDLRAAERQTAKVHTKIRDCRHSRRM